LFFIFFERLREDAGKTSSFFMLLIVVSVSSLPSLTLLGMEHVLHALLTTLFVCTSVGVIINYNQSKKDRVTLLILASLLPIVRYEGLFAIVTSCVFLFFNRRYTYALMLGAASVVPLFIYGFISQFNDWFFLPNSILLKGAQKNKKQG